MTPSLVQAAVCVPAVCVLIFRTELESGTRKCITRKRANNNDFFLSVFSVPMYNVK